MSARRSDIALFADTDCDITPEMAREWGYHLIPMPYSLNGVEIFPYEDGKDIDIAAFYAELKKGVVPKTSGLSPSKYISLFEPVLKEGKDILYPHFSSKLSGTFSAMKIAIDTLKEKYPERTIYAIDTKAITGLALCMLDDIARIADQGKSIPEIIAEFEATVLNSYSLYAFASDLQFFRRSGRLSGISAFMGSMLSIRPLISIDDEGRMGAVGKAVGRQGAISKIQSAIDKLGVEIAKHPLYIVHSDNLPAAQELAAYIERKYGAEPRIIWINPTAGVHCGPGCLGVAFHALRRQM